MGELRILTAAGDERLEWDPADKAQVAAARKRFRQLKKDGYRFYAVEETKGKPVERFSAKLGKVIAAPGAQTKKDRATGRRPLAMAGGPLSRAEAPRSRRRL